MTGQVYGRWATGTSSAILTSYLSGNGTASIDEGSSDFLSSNLIDHCIGHSVGLSCGQVWMMRNGHEGKESGERSILMPSGGFWSV